MTKKKVAMRGAKFILAGLALIAVVIGAECVRAGVDHYETTGSIAEVARATDLVAAELDPVFVRKLALRSRAPYERAHPLASQARD